MGFCVLHLSVIHFKWPWLTSYFQLAVVTRFSGSCHCGEEAMVDTVTFYSVVRSLGLTFEIRCGFLLVNEKMKLEKYLLAYMQLQISAKRTAS